MMQDIAPAEQVTEIMNSIRRIVRALRLASRAQEKQNGLSAAQFLVPQTLAESGPLSINDLAARTFTHQSSVSVVVTKLVNRNLAERNISPDDARTVQISLTPAGIALSQREAPLIQERMFEALRQMSPHNRTQLADRLSEFLVSAQIADEPATMFFEEEE